MWFQNSVSNPERRIHHIINMLNMLLNQTLIIALVYFIANIISHTFHFSNCIVVANDTCADLCTRDPNSQDRDVQP